MKTIANEMTRSEMIAIINIMNTRNNLGIARVSKLSTPALTKMINKNEDQAIQIGAEINIDCCFINNNQPETVNTKPGVIAQIEMYLNKNATFTIAALHDHLCKNFPDRSADKMLATIKTQVPSRMAKDRGFEFAREKGGIYHVSRAQ